MSEIEAALLEIEERLLRCEWRRDPDFLNRVLADEFREYGSSGRIFDKTAMLALLSTETFEGASLFGFKTLPIGDNAFLATYHALKSSSAAAGAAAASLRSSIWVWRDGRWQMLFHQGTGLSQGAQVRK